MVDRPLFFLHIPKTAGLSLHWAMVNAFPMNRVARVNSEHELWQTPVATMHRLAYLSAHAHYGFHTIFPNEPFTFTFLRSPVKRSVSAYWHLRNEDSRHFDNVAFRDIIMECKRRSLEEILLDNSSPALSQFSNIQTWYLSGSGVRRCVESGSETSHVSVADWYHKPKRPDAIELDETHLERAMRTLDSVPLFGLMERMQSSLEVFRRRLGFDPSSMPAINRRKTESRDHALSDLAITRLNELTALDRQLYDYAARRFIERNEEMSEPDGDIRPFSPLKTGDGLARELNQKVSEGFIGGGWYPRESRGNEAWCWNGFTNESWIDLYINVVSDLDISLELRSCLDWNLAKSLKLCFRGKQLVTRFRRGKKDGVLSARLPSKLTGLGPRIVRAEIPGRDTVVPANIRKSSADTRNLGIAMQGFHVRQLPARSQ